MNYLREYFKRNASESGFSSEKRPTGGLIILEKERQKRIARILQGTRRQL
ncbi:MAG: hypothetical protein QW292_07175 [Candidatus Parvarchaeota archaeon]